MTRNIVQAAATFLLALCAPLLAQQPAAPLSLKPVSMAAPEIPDEICQRRLAGWVALDFVVLPDGSVAQVQVTASEPKGMFDSAAAGAVAKWIYPPQAAPVKMQLRLPMSFTDCRAEQRRVVVPASAEGVSQVDCPEIAAGARQLGYRFEPQESGRAVLQGEPAQVYSAPRPHCFVVGRTLRPGKRLKAWIEYEAFSLVGGEGESEGLAVWVWSHQLRDTVP